ncbi:MAG: immunoglobulin domain-containing protein [Verrucomicrobia bacterium]|nr:immunoglobulin domain-containing protein [Verrucomicrobiota bacterium]
MKPSTRSFLFATFLPATLACVFLTSAECFAESTNCVMAPADIVSWWRAEGNAQDATGANNGALAGNTIIGAGRVGQAFVFDGNNDAVNLGNPTNLQLQNFTLEAWVKRASATVTSQNSPTFGNLFAHGWGGYALGIEYNGRLYLSRVGLSSVGIDSAVTDTNWHHVAVTKQGSSVVFFVDGVVYPAPAYDPGFTFASSFAIGAAGDDLAASFYGAIDEMSFYNRALSATEVLAIYQADTNGKCAGPPVIREQPANQIVAVGGSTSFTVMAVGSPHLTYQWRFNQTNLLSVNDPTLTLPNVQPGNAGNYSVVVTNLYGAATSSVAVLTLAAPPCANPPLGMVGWWPGNGNANDIAGTNNASFLNGAAYAAGKVDQAFSFNGGGNHLRIPASPSLNVGSGSGLTIEAWVNPATSAQQPILEWAPGGGMYGTLLWLSVQSAGSVYADLVDSSGNLHLIQTAGGIITNNGFQHIAVTYDKTTGLARIFVNGSMAAESSLGSFSAGTGADLYIGYRPLTAPFGPISFNGLIDEVALYSRALSASDVQAIYNAGAGGKCTEPAAPVILTQPTNQAAGVSANAAFTVMASGTFPLTYQWRFNETNLVGLNNATLTLPDIQFSNAGNYSVVITNLYGAATSAVAVLTVLPTPPCVTPPADLVSWWRAEGNGLDAGSGNNGVLTGNAGYGTGRTGQAFVFDGNADFVLFGNPANLQLQDLTIEAWVKRSSASVISLDQLSGPGGDIIAYGQGGYGFGMFNDGSMFLSKAGVSAVIVASPVTNTNWNHIAVTKSDGTVVFYVNGHAHPAPGTYNPGFTFSTSGAIGGRGDGGGNTFYGLLDEVAIYSRALAPNEIQSIYNASSVGKCVVPIPPTIVAHPQSISVLAGANTTLTVVAAGFAPLNYQWRFNGTDLAGATNSSLTLNNVQFSHVGNYSVQVTNVAGSVISSNAALTVTVPTPVIRAVGTNAMAGAPVTVPITLAANGNENTLGLSLNFSTQRLAYASVTWGDSVAGAALLLNTNQTGLGRLGLAVSFPSGTAFPAGTQEVIRVHFNSLPLTSPTPVNTTFSFGDLPVLRELYDTQLQPLPANYQSGTVTLTPTVFEGDVFPRPNGNQALTSADWAQAARFAARLDIPGSSSEFQRADAAPRATLGDGRIKVTDWVQTGRYIAGLDPAAAIGGPTVEIAPNGSSVPGSRQLRVGSTNLLQGQSATITVELQAQGDENALGFTLSFDPAALTFNNVNLGSNMGGASLTANTIQAATGRLGLVLGLSTGTSVGAGSRELVEVAFTASGNVTGDFPITLTDQLVMRCVSDTLAGELPAEYIGGMIAINALDPAPTLAIAQSGTNVVLSWPGWAGDFSLQTLALNDSWSHGWTNAPAQWQTNGSVISLTLPIAPEARFFRLLHP